MSPTITDAFYPIVRNDRDQPVPTTAPAPGAPLATAGGQNSMLWPFFIARTNGVAIAVSPSINGPAIVEEIAFQHNLSGGTLPTWSLYASDDGTGQGAAFAASVIPSGDRLIETPSIASDAATVTTDNQGMISTTLLSTVGYWRFPLRKIVRKQTFFLKLRINASATNQLFLNGYCRILQSVPDNVLANFL